MISTQCAAQPQLHSYDASLNSIEADSPAAVPVRIVGVNANWRRLLTQAGMVAPYLQIASIEGEHGTGKETLARHLHARCPLAKSPFQHHDAREWLATEADPGLLSGFLYLDRVDLLAVPGQGLLLRLLKALQDRPPGRLILVASSQTPLRQMTAQGLFLPDLTFRLTAVRFAVPPLRQRKEDLASLAQELLDRLCKRYHHQPVTLDHGTLARLLLHHWPGNVRELASVLEAALLETASGVIRPEDLPIHSDPAPRLDESPALPPKDLSLDAVVHGHVQHVLFLNHGNKLRAARQLGISRSTLYRILGNQTIMEQ